MRFEEAPRRRPAPAEILPDRRLAHALQARSRCACRAQGRGAVEDRLARAAENRKGGRVIVLTPPGKLVERHRFEVRIPRRFGLEVQHRTQVQEQGRGEGRPPHCPASVATSCQLGSRAPRGRAKVQTSVTSTTASGSPSMTVPPASRVAVISFDRKRTVTWADAALHLDILDLGPVDRHERRLGLVAPPLALGDGPVEALVDILRQQVLEGLAVALGKGRDDHLVGHLGAFNEARRIETRLVADDRVKPVGDPGARLGDALPPLGIELRSVRRAALRPDAGQPHHIVGLDRACRRLAAGNRIERRPFVPGLLPEHGSQAPDHEYRQCEKDDGRDVERILHRRSGRASGASKARLLCRHPPRLEPRTTTPFGRIWGSRLVTSTRPADKRASGRRLRPILFGPKKRDSAGPTSPAACGWAGAGWPRRMARPSHSRYQEPSRWPRIRQATAPRPTARPP